MAMFERNKLQLEVVKSPVQSGRRVRFNVTRTNFSSAQTKKHIAAIGFAEKVINSLEFKQKLSARKTFTTSSFNGVQVYDKLMTGEENLQKGKDYEFDITVVMYEENNSTVGYTMASTIKIWVNNKFFKNYSPGEIAGNAVHEYLHKQGFGHTSNYTKEREFSVPYFVGYLVRDMVDDFIAGKQTLTDLYPIEDVPPMPSTPSAPAPAPTPKPIPTPKQVCGWTKKWGFIPWYECWYE